MQSFKQERVTQIIMQEINQMIVLKKIKDPRVSSKVSVLHVKASKDLTSATVYISSFLEEKTLNQTVAILNHARGFIQAELHKKHKWRNTPKLLFKASDALKTGERVLKKIEESSQHIQGTKKDTENSYDDDIS